jgi:SAM-dependent methyltransferase
MEKIVVIGFGWVGQANAIALVKLGFSVSYFDIVTPPHHYKNKFNNEYSKITALKDILEIDSKETSYVVCVGDRTLEDGSQDISLIQKVIDSLHGAKGNIILRSTVLPQNLGKLKFDFYMPEFLHEKMAVEECIEPFYFVVGTPLDSTKVEPNFFYELEKRSYKVFRGTPEEASYIKYLSNLWNSTRIAFINEFGNTIAEPRNKKTIGEIERVVDFVLERGNYLKYGRAFGGHCLPKDTYAFSTAYNIPMLRGVHQSNLRQEQMQRQYTDLPEWFSFWDYKSKKNMLRLIRDELDKLNSLKFVWHVRQGLKPLVIKGYDAMVPKRTLSDVADVWNKKGEQNPRFFMQTKTKSGLAVDEFELQKTGQEDYKKYVLEDKIIREHFDTFNDKSVLEIGCGIGRMTESLSKNFQHVYAIDISDVMIENAKKRLSQLPNVSVQVNDGETIPYDNDKFNFIFSYLVLQHIPSKESIQEYLAHMHRTLKPGGLAKVQLRTGPGIQKWKWSYGVALKPAEAREMAEQAGFNVVSHEVESIKNLWLWLRKI